MNQEKVIVIDFGGQYNQLVARRVRECNVYCEIYSYKTPLEQIKAMNPKGIILTGGPNSTFFKDFPRIRAVNRKISGQNGEILVTHALLAPQEWGRKTDFGENGNRKHFNLFDLWEEQNER